MDTQQIPQDRLEKFLAGFIAKGSHERFEAGACALEWVSYLAGEPHSDHPACSSRVIGALVIRVNDLLDDAGRQRMKAIIPKLIGTAASHEVEQARGWLAADWSVRFATPVWLDLAGLTDHAAVLRALPEITAETYHTSRAPLRAAREASFGARARALAVAASDAASDADAVAVAAAAAVAVADAVADAAKKGRGAKYGAAYNAAYPIIKKAVVEKLQPATLSIRESCLDLIERMIALRAA